MFELLKDVFLMCEKKKKSTSNYKAKKKRTIIKDLGLYYEKINACKNDCVIYYKNLNVQFLEFLDESPKEKVLRDL